jgi:hypothetical protein
MDIMGNNNANNLYLANAPNSLRFVAQQDKRNKAKTGKFEGVLTLVGNPTKTLLTMKKNST